MDGSTQARGRYIVLEGGEGVGKTTQVRRLQKRLESSRIHAVVVREPGGDHFAEAGRELLLGDLDREAETEVLLFNALRAQVLLSSVIPKLSAGVWVLSDRSRLSTITYQAYGHGVDLDWTRAVCELTGRLCEPDLEIVLTVDERTAVTRRDERGASDRFEQLGEEFHRRVTSGYLTEAKRYALPVVDGAATEDTVEERLWSCVAPLVASKHS